MKTKRKKHVECGWTLINRKHGPIFCGMLAPEGVMAFLAAFRTREGALKYRGDNTDWTAVQVRVSEK